MDGAVYSLWLQRLIRAGEVNTHGTHLGRVINHVTVSALDGASGERLDIFGGEAGRVVPFQSLALRDGFWCLLGLQRQCGMVVMHPRACIMERSRGSGDNLKVLLFGRQRGMGRVHGSLARLYRERQFGITQDKESRRRVERGGCRCRLWAVAKSADGLRLIYLTQTDDPLPESRRVLLCA